jgi:hypothetical protein
MNLQPLDGITNSAFNSFLNCVEEMEDVVSWDPSHHGYDIMIIPEPTPIAPGGIRTVVNNIAFSSFTTFSQNLGTGCCISTNVPTRNPRADNAVSGYSLTLSSSRSSACSPIDASEYELSLSFSANMAFEKAEGEKQKAQRSSIFATPSESNANHTFVVPSTKSKNMRARKYNSAQWDERFQELLLYRRQHGHLFVPHEYPPNPRLAQWVKR